MFNKCFRKNQQNEFVDLLEDYIRKIRKNELTQEEKTNLLLFYLQSMLPEPSDMEEDDNQSMKYMMLGWYVSSILGHNKVKEN